MRGLVLLLLWLTACVETTREPERDAGQEDGGSSDAGARDAGDAGGDGGDAGPPDYAVCGETLITGLDEDCDGTPDLACKVFLGAQGEDELGDALTANDDDCDGRLDRTCIVTHWDEAERRERIDLDPECDGRLNACSNALYTEDGIELDYRREYMCDVRFLGIESCRRAEYDEETRTARYSDDDTCDGDDETCTIMGFDEAGQTTSVEVREQSCDGPILRCAGQERDGAVVIGFIDERCDDELEVCQRLEYTMDGRPLAEELDSRCNGPSPDDACVMFEWSDEENARITVDTGCDGTVDSCTGSEARYDDEGLLIERYTFDSSFTTGCDQAITCSTFEYDDDGNRISQVLDFGCNDVLNRERDNCVKWIYEDGQLVAEIADIGCDQKACTTTRYRADICF